ncbi:MAG: GLPGLI family protein [Flavisolibacter sp.]
MKKYVLASLLFFSLAADAQVKEGRIIYERTSQLPIRAFNMDPAIAAQMPKSRVDQFELLFSQSKSLWQFLPSSENDGDGQTIQGGGMVIRFAGVSNDITYHDFEAASRTDQREIFERTFLITDSIRRQDWKLSDETKTILDYTARKATTTRINTSSRMTMENGEMKTTIIDDTVTVVAWYTTDVPVPAGPDYQGQLPGLILELDIDNGRSVYKVLEFSAKVNTSKIKPPKEGKKMTAEQFAKERQKLAEEMRKNMPEGNRFRIQQ